MQRREFIGLLGATALSLPQPGYAQTDVGLPLVAVLMPFKKDDDYRIAALRKGLQETGFIEGTNYSLAVRYGEVWCSNSSEYKLRRALSSNALIQRK